MPAKKGVGLNPISQIHYTDHLAVICVIMDIPLLFLEPQDLAVGQKYYPGLHCIFEEFQNFNPEYLIQNYDVLFMSDLWDRRTFRQKFALLEAKYGKELRSVHIPHGFSDKGFYLRKCAAEDITLIYGQNMIDLLKHEKVFDHLNGYVISGNYRYTYYKKNKAFFEKMMQEEVLSRFIKQQPIILYAPTWKDLEESTTFFDACSTLIDNLPHDYNMIIKLHPRLELDDAGMYYRIVGTYEERPNVLFLKDFPLVYPLLAHTDIFISDMSSIGYDFLAFNKPMYFLNQHRRDSAKDRGLYLYRCGVEVRPEQYGDIYNIIEKTLPTDQERFSKIRGEVYDYTFGVERPFKEIKADIIKAYSTEV